MTPRTAVLFGLALILLFCGFELWLFSLIDRTIDRQAEARRIVMHEHRRGEMFYCYAAKAAKRKENWK